MASAEFDSLSAVLKSERIVYVLYRWIAHSDVHLSVDIVGTEINRACLRKRQIQFELAHPQSECVCGQLEKTSKVDEAQITVAESTIEIGTGDTNIIIHPEGDIAAKISCGEDAEESRLKIGTRNRRRKYRAGCRARDLGIVIVVGVTASVLEKLVVAQSDRGQTRDGARIDDMRPQFFLRRRS